MVRRIARWSFCLSVVLVALVASFGSAVAAPRTADIPPANSTRLERAYKIERQNLRELEEHFRQAGAYADEITRLVARLKQHGVDTTSLDQALSTFHGRMADARRYWETARDILQAHAGSDAQGHVIDSNPARMTVEQAHANLAQARTIGYAALRDLRAAVLAFRKTHR